MIKDLCRVTSRYVFTGTPICHPHNMILSVTAAPRYIIYFYMSQLTMKHRCVVCLRRGVNHSLSRVSFQSKNCRVSPLSGIDERLIDLVRCRQRLCMHFIYLFGKHPPATTFSLRQAITQTPSSSQPAQ